MDVSLRFALFAAVLPGALAALGALAARFLRPESPGRPVAAALGLAAGYVVGHYGITGVSPSFPPTDSLHWAPYLALGTALVLSLVEGLAPRQAVASWVLALACAGGAAYLIGRPTWGSAETGASTIFLGIGCTALAAVVAGMGLELAGRALPPWALLFSLTAAASGAAGVAVLSNSTSLSLLFGALAATAGGLAVGGLLLQSAAPGRAFLGTYATVAGSLLLYLRLYGYPQPPLLPIAVSGAAFLAPFVAARLRVPARLMPWLALGLTAALAGAAAALAYTPAPPDGGGYSD